jgi:2-methylcitrate dehydratase
MSKLHLLKRNSNQARGLAEYAINFMKSNNKIDSKVIERVKMFHTDSVVCGLSALALKTNAPTILRKEALVYHGIPSNYNVPRLTKSRVFGSKEWVQSEKAIVANCSAVREWDSNGTVFGYNKNIPGHQAGEFGHNDFYPVAIAASHIKGLNGSDTVKGMLLIDEIRGRLAEVFSLKSYKIDHVVHGAIASAVTYGSMIGATVDEIEHAVGMVVAHYIPWRAIRAGKQLSDSKGASAAISTEAAIMSVHRAMDGFIGPKDIFRNPEAIFRYFENTKGDSPFDIALGNEGSDFSVMGMHFKLGLYEHQSAGALDGMIQLIQNNPKLVDGGISSIKNIEITAYEPAFGIIGDPAKREPKTRQSADHSMVFIVSRLLKKAMENKSGLKSLKNKDDYWKSLILTPSDYSYKAVFCPDTKEIMKKITFVHGGIEYDSKYREGIPTKVDIILIAGE